MSSQAVDVHPGTDTNVQPGLDADLESLARRIAREVWDYTGGLPGRWVPMITIQERLALEDETATTNALQLAVEQRWLEEFGGYNSIRLTGDGRSLG